MVNNNAHGDDAIRTRAPRPEDYPAVQEIIARSFEDHVRQNRGALEEYAEETWYDPDHLLVTEVEGRVVSQMGVRDGVLWIEGVGFPAGLVGTVCALPEVRGQGIGGRMLASASTWMEERGMALSYLHTSVERYGFYGRGGYRPTLIQRPRAEIRVRRAREQAGPPAGITMRQARPADARALNQIYEMHYGAMSGTWSRNEHFWGRRLAGRPKLWVDGVPEFRVAENGELLAYIAVIPQSVPQIIELAARPGRGEPAARALVAQVAQTATAQNLELDLRSHDPLWTELQVFGVEDRTTDAEVLVRMQDVGAFLKAAEPLLTQRAREAGLSCVLNVAGADPVRLGEGGRGLELDLSAHDLCALVYNGRVLANLLEARELRIRAGSRRDVEELFPDTRPARCPLDAY